MEHSLDVTTAALKIAKLVLNMTHNALEGEGEGEGGERGRERGGEGEGEGEGEGMSQLCTCTYMYVCHTNNRVFIHTYIQCVCVTVSGGVRSLQPMMKYIHIHYGSIRAYKYVRS